MIPEPADSIPAPRTALTGRTILQIIPDLDAGGAERTTIDIAAALVEAGARALVACRGGRLVSELQARGGIWLEFPAATKNPARMLMNCARLTRVIHAENVAITHARSRAPAWVALGATGWTKTPFVTTYHGSYSGDNAMKLLYNSVMARGDAVIANSDFTASQIGAKFPFSRAKIRTIHRGTCMRKFSLRAISPERIFRLRNQWDVAPDEQIVLLAARLTGWKGQKILIDAARILVDRGFTDARFILAGDAQGREAYVTELTRHISQNRLENVVKIVGHCADMPAALLAAAVVAVPSTEPEAFGRVAVEAQAMGIPVVVSDLGAVSETVLTPPRVEARARTGWRVPPGDANALADAVGEALSLGASAREAYAARARTHVEKQFSLERMCNATLDVYAALLETGAVRNT